MSLQQRIASTFAGRAFERPLFYQYPGGLRFELSRDGNAIQQFLQAHRSATAISADIFASNGPIVVCLRPFARCTMATNRFSFRELFRELRRAGVVLPRVREIWLDPVEEDDLDEEGMPEWWLTIAFEVPLEVLDCLLWCAFAIDFGIRPRPECSIRLIDLNRGVLVFPYDDRGMDVVGPNFQLLLALYQKHHSYLLQYDIEAMDATFAQTLQRDV
jgi:hypothetical protein